MRGVWAVLALAVLWLGCVTAHPAGSGPTGCDEVPGDVVDCIGCRSRVSADPGPGRDRPLDRSAGPDLAGCRKRWDCLGRWLLRNLRVPTWRAPDSQTQNPLENRPCWRTDKIVRRLPKRSLGVGPSWGCPSAIVTSVRRFPASSFRTLQT